MATEIGEIRGEKMNVRIYVDDADRLIFDSSGTFPCSKHEISEILGEIVLEMFVERESRKSGKPLHQCFHLEPKRPNRG